MEAFDNTSGSGTPKTYSEMQQEEPTRAECCSATASENGYPFEAVVRKTQLATKFILATGSWHQILEALGFFTGKKKNRVPTTDIILVTSVIQQMPQALQTQSIVSAEVPCVRSGMTEASSQNMDMHTITQIS